MADLTTDSITYGGIELLSGAGGSYHIVDGQRGLGDPQRVVDSVRAQLTQGSAVVGRFTDNRHLSLQVLVLAPDRPTLASRCDALAVEADRSVNTLIWTPSGTGLANVFDTWRAQVTTAWSGKWEASFARVMRLEFDALPFGRSDTRVTISGTSGTIAVADFSTPAGFGYVTVDSADTTLYPDLLSGDPTQVTNVPMPTTGSNHAAVTTSPTPFEGTGSTQLDLNWYKSAAAYSYTITHLGSSQSPGWTETVNVPARGTAAATLTPVGAVALDLSVNTRINCAIWAQLGGQKVYLELDDTSGGSQTFVMSPTKTTAASQWDVFTVDVSGSGLDLANINGWQLTVAVGSKDYSAGMASTPVMLGQLRAYPVSSTLVTTAQGGSFQLAGVPGSADADATISLDRGGTNTMGGFLVARAPQGGTAPAIVPMSGSPAAGATVAPTTLRGTYKVIIAGAASFVANVSYTLTITQKVNGTAVTGGVKTLAGTGVTGKMVGLGELTFPFVDVAPQVTDVVYSFSWSGTAINEVLLIDTESALVWVPSMTAAKYVWIDEATALDGLGGVWTGNSADRSDAASLLGAAGIQISGAFSLPPGDSVLTAYCPDGLPNLQVDFAPRWMHERVS